MGISGSGVPQAWEREPVVGGATGPLPGPLLVRGAFATSLRLVVVRPLALPLRLGCHSPAVTGTGSLSLPVPA